MCYRDTWSRMWEVHCLTFRPCPRAFDCSALAPGLLPIGNKRPPNGPSVWYKTVEYSCRFNSKQTKNRSHSSCFLHFLFLSLCLSLPNRQWAERYITVVHAGGPLALLVAGEGPEASGRAAAGTAELLRRTEEPGRARSVQPGRRAGGTEHQSRLAAGKYRPCVWPGLAGVE